MGSTVPMSVWDNVKKYFKERLHDRYDLQDIISYSHPGDSYLYMVIAKEKDYPETNVQLGCGPWVVWTTWNESTQSLVVIMISKHMKMLCQSVKREENKEK